MDTPQKLRNLLSMVQCRPNTWEYVGEEKNWWKFIWLFNPACFVLIHVTGTGYTLRTNDGIITHAGSNVLRAVDVAEQHFLRRYGNAQ